MAVIMVGRVGDDQTEEAAVVDEEIIDRWPRVPARRRPAHAVAIINLVIALLHLFRS